MSAFIQHLHMMHRDDVRFAATRRVQASSKRRRKKTPNLRPFLKKTNFEQTRCQVQQRSFMENT